MMYGCIQNHKTRGESGVLKVAHRFRQQPKLLLKDNSDGLGEGGLVTVNIGIGC